MSLPPPGAVAHSYRNSGAKSAPVFGQLVGVAAVPLHDEAESARRQMPFHTTGVDLHFDFKP